MTQRRDARLLGIDDPHNWTADDPQQTDVDAALRARRRTRFTCCWPIVPERGIRRPRGIPLTLAAHPRRPVLLPLIGGRREV